MLCRCLCICHITALVKFWKFLIQPAKQTILRNRTRDRKMLNILRSTHAAKKKIIPHAQSYDIRWLFILNLCNVVDWMLSNDKECRILLRANAATQQCAILDVSCATKPLFPLKSTVPVAMKWKQITLHIWFIQLNLSFMISQWFSIFAFMWPQLCAWHENIRAFQYY